MRRIASAMPALVVFALFALIAAPGCDEMAQEKEGTVLLHEDAEVLQLAYVPASQGTTSGGVGFNSAGDMHFTPSQSVSTDEVWAVVLRCKDHGRTFSLRGKSFYEASKVGQVVELEYVELLTNGQVTGYRTRRVVRR